MIIVGVDGSEHSAEALRWALKEAKLRNADVLALHAWTMPAPPGRMGFYAEALQDPAAYQEGAERMLEGFIAEAGVETRAVQGSPANELIRAAEGAELLVVGSRGHGGFASLLIGSVSQQCAAHSPCPIVIVRAAE